MPHNPWLRLLNNWLHDVGTGLWAACLLVVAVLDGRLMALSSTAAREVSSVQRLVFGLLVAALVDIAVTGVFRLLYWRAETPPHEMPAKRPALIGKHIAFLIVYGGGTAWAWLLVR